MAISTEWVHTVVVEGSSYYQESKLIRRRETDVSRKLQVAYLRTKPSTLVGTNLLQKYQHSKLCSLYEQNPGELTALVSNCIMNCFSFC